MSIRIKVKQSSKCKKCEGIGYYSFPMDASDFMEKYGLEEPVEYVCNTCEGSGKTWKDRDLPISSLKKLLK